MKLLIIEDEKSPRDNVFNYFNEDICESCNCLADALEKLSAYKYDCILHDIGLSDSDCFGMLDYLHENNRSEALIIISAKNSLNDKILGLNAGADDYITKPFHLAELKARVAATCRRKNLGANNKLVFHEIAINLLGRTVSVSGTTIVLTRKEYDILLYFIANKGKVIPKTDIARDIWDDEIIAHNNFDFIYTHIKNLRKKLLDARCADYIKSIYGVGYKFMAE